MKHRNHYGSMCLKPLEYSLEHIKEDEKEQKEEELMLNKCGYKWNFVYEFDHIFSSNLGNFSILTSNFQKGYTEEKINEFFQEMEAKRV